MIRVLIVEDDALMAAGLRGVLEREVAGEAADGSEAVYRTRLVQPDVVLMDIRCPAWTGSPPPATSWPRSRRSR